MAIRDESQMFSLAALTERSPSVVPAPKRVSPDPDNIDLGELARAPSFAADFGPPVYPLAGPRADEARVAPNPASRTAPVVQLGLVVGALLLAVGIIATAVWSVETPTPPSPLTAPAAAPPGPLPKPETKPMAAAPAARAVETLAEPAASGARPSTVESTSHTPRPARRPRPSASPKLPPRVTREAPRPAGPCAHCPPQDLACNIKCRAN